MRRRVGPGHGAGLWRKPRDPACSNKKGEACLRKSFPSVSIREIRGSNGRFQGDLVMSDILACPVIAGLPVTYSENEKFPEWLTGDVAAPGSCVTAAPRFPAHPVLRAALLRYSASFCGTEPIDLRVAEPSPTCPSLPRGENSRLVRLRKTKKA